MWRPSERSEAQLGRMILVAILTCSSMPDTVCGHHLCEHMSMMPHHHEACLFPGYMLRWHRHAALNLQTRMSGSRNNTGGPHLVTQNCSKHSDFETYATTHLEHSHNPWAAWVKATAHLSEDLVGSCKVALFCEHSSNAIDSIQIACTALARSAHVAKKHLHAFLAQTTTTPKKAWTQGVTPQKNPRGDTHPSRRGLQPCRGAPGKIEGPAVLKDISPVQAPAKHDLAPGRPRQVSRPCRTLRGPSHLGPVESITTAMACCSRAGRKAFPMLNKRWRRLLSFPGLTHPRRIP